MAEDALDHELRSQPRRRVSPTKPPAVTIQTPVKNEVIDEEDEPRYLTQA